MLVKYRAKYIFFVLMARTGLSISTKLTGQTLGQRSSAGGP